MTAHDIKLVDRGLLESLAADGEARPGLAVQGQTAVVRKGRGSRKVSARARAVDRARRYLADIDPAVAGQQGHDRLFYAACRLVLGFGLTTDEAYPLLQEYSGRCQPPWSEQELRHKLTDADQQPGDRGFLLHDGPASGHAPDTEQPPEEGEEDDESVLVLVSLDAVQPRPVDWLWDYRIPRRATTLFDGDPGLGKTTLCTDLAARVTRGWQMPPAAGTAVVREPRGVLLLSAEDDLETTTRPRLEAAGADLARVFALEAILHEGEERPPVLPWDLGQVEKLIVAKDIALMIVDPFFAYLDGKIDSNKDQDVRRCMHKLKLLAQRTGVAILLVRHLNKDQEKSARYRGGGSIGITAASRSALAVGRDPQDPDTCVLATVKCNLGPLPRSLTYTLDTVTTGVARVAWGAECDLTADDILGRGGRRTQSKVDQCGEAIQAVLAGGALEAEEFEGRLKAMGYSQATIRRARKKWGVDTRHDGFGEGSRWLAFLPPVEGRQP